MKRTDLMALAAQHGVKPGIPMTPQQKTVMRNAISAKLNAKDIEEAPRIFEGSGGRPMTLTEAVNALMEEVQ